MAYSYHAFLLCKLPQGSSHALIGGTVGATLLAAGTSAVSWSGLMYKVVAPALVAPLLAAAVAAALTFLTYRLVRRLRPERAMRGYRWGQIASSSLVALSHGTNDAQKTMGIITLALVANGNLPTSGFEVPTWVILAAATAMACLYKPTFGEIHPPFAQRSTLCKMVRE